MDEELHKKFMTRCLALAKKGQGQVAPNPMVGAVLVHNGKIIGEGFHQKYGEAHAEVNCINDALQNAPGLISSSILYVSLEPCAHFGKTPPCADLIVQHKIPRVVVACRDSFEEVNGRGVEKLKSAGIEVTEGVLEREAIELNKRFFTFHNLQRPYIVLKWAQTADGFMALGGKSRLLISNEITNRLVHKWRTEETAISIGANTAVADDPLLDSRLWPGKAPVKIIIDPNLTCSESLRMFQQGEQVIVANVIRSSDDGKVVYLKANHGDFLQEIIAQLYEKKISSILVEGGRQTLRSFIDAGLWDEARVITNTNLTVGSGLRSPELLNAEKVNEQFILNDRIEFFKNRNAGF